MAPPLPVIKIVAPEEGGGGAKILQKIMDNSVPHLCHYDSKVFWNRGGGIGGGGIGRALKSYKLIMAPPLSVIKIVASGGGWRQNPTKDNGAPLSLSLR